MRKIFLAIGAFLVGSHSAYASEMDLTRQIYTSEILVQLFLGFCALIIVLQVVPSMLLLFGMVKGLFSASKSVEAKQIQ